MQHVSFSLRLHMEVLQAVFETALMQYLKMKSYKGLSGVWLGFFNILCGIYTLTIYAITRLMKNNMALDVFILAATLSGAGSIAASHL